MRLFDPDNPLAAEIQQEMAASYFAGCRKMVDSLKALRDFDRFHGSAALTRAQIKRRSELVEQARERVHFVVIQREALQLSGADQFFRDYEVPDEIRLHLRPKQR